MAQIKIKRGLKANLPALADGELAFCEDTKELFVGSSSGNTLLTTPVYNTLADLQAAYPNGTNQPAWVIADNGWYYWSGTGTGDTTAPNNVTNLTASNITSSTLTLSWTASTSTDIASYDVYQGSILLGNITGTSYNVMGLTQNTSYTFTVKAKDTSGNVAIGTSVTQLTATPADTTPPNDVANLTTSNLSTTSVILNWTASTSTDVASYDIYNGATLITNTINTSYTVTGLTASTQYTLTVKAKDSSGNVATGTQVTFTTTAVTTDTTPPDPVISLATGTVTATSVPLSWSKPSATDVASFEVAYSSDGGTNYTIASSSVAPTVSTYTVTGLNPSTSYVFRVVAVDTSGNRSTPTTVTGITAGNTITTNGLILDLDATNLSTLVGLNGTVNATVTWQDQSGTGNNCILTPISGGAIQASDFNATTGWKRSSYTKSALLPWNNFDKFPKTWEFIVKVDTGSNEIMYKNTQGTNYTQLKWNGTTTVRGLIWGLAGGNAYTEFDDTSNTIDTTKYVQFVATVDPTANKPVSIYANGTLVKQSNSASTLPTFTDNDATATSELYPIPAGHYIKHIRCYNRALTSAEISSNYSAQSSLLV